MDPNERDGRALKRDIQGNNVAGLRAALTLPKMSHATLQKIFILLRETPETASATTKDIQAAQRGIFLSMRCCIEVPQKDRYAFI